MPLHVKAENVPNRKVVRGAQQANKFVSYDWKRMKGRIFS
jgi:hypothetical protein